MQSALQAREDVLHVKSLDWNKLILGGSLSADATREVDRVAECTAFSCHPGILNIC